MSKFKLPERRNEEIANAGVFTDWFRDDDGNPIIRLKVRYADIYSRELSKLEKKVGEQFASEFKAFDAAKDYMSTERVHFVEMYLTGWEWAEGYEDIELTKENAHELFSSNEAEWMVREAWDFCQNRKNFKSDKHTDQVIKSRKAAEMAAKN